MTWPILKTRYIDLHGCIIFKTHTFVCHHYTTTILSMKFCHATRPWTKSTPCITAVHYLLIPQIATVSIASTFRNWSGPSATLSHLSQHLRTWSRTTPNQRNLFGTRIHDVGEIYSTQTDGILSRRVPNTWLYDLCVWCCGRLSQAVSRAGESITRVTRYHYIFFDLLSSKFV